jgi:hypothetical protein
MVDKLQQIKLQQIEQKLKKIRQRELLAAVELGIAEAARGDLATLDIEAIKQAGRQTLLDS